MFSAFFLLPLEQRPAREREAGGSPAATTTEPPPASGNFRPANGTARQRSEDGDRMEEESAAARGSTRASIRTQPECSRAPRRAQRWPWLGGTAASVEVAGSGAGRGAPARPPAASSEDECVRSCDHAAQGAGPAGLCSHPPCRMFEAPAIRRTAAVRHPAVPGGMRQVEGRSR